MVATVLALAVLIQRPEYVHTDGIKCCSYFLHGGLCMYGSSNCKRSAIPHQSHLEIRKFQYRPAAEASPGFAGPFKFQYGPAAEAFPGFAGPFNIILSCFV